MSKQNNLTDFLTDVADAIRQKKGTQAPINPQDFSSEIASIPTGGSNPLQDMLDRSSDTDGSYFFYVDISYNYKCCFKNLTYAYLAKLDFSNKKYTNTKAMFFGCVSLTAVPQLDLSSVISADQMFFHCSSLTTIPQLDLSKVTDSSQMFNGCKALEEVPQLDLNSSDYTNSMFFNCGLIKKLDFLNIKTLNYNFAMYCAKLETLIIRNTTTPAILNATSALTGTPIADGTGYIYVPDDLVEDYKQATNWSTYASQIKGLSELPQGE